MTTSYRLSEAFGGEQEARFHIDGKRVSRDTYEALKARAYAAGRLDCFHTHCKPVKGTFRRFNYCTATI